MRGPVRVLLCLGALASAAAAGAQDAGPIDHLAVMKDLLAMPRPKSCDPEKAELTSLQSQVCSAHAYRDADAALNRAYVAAANDAEAGERAKLKTAQRAWLTYRDAECARQASRYAGGSLGPVTYGQCLVDVTRARTKALAAMLEE